MIFESHAHYDDEAFHEDRDILLSSMKDNGVEYIVNVSADFESIDPIYELTRKYDFIYGTVGVHPGAAKNMTQERFEYLKKAALRDKIVAIGEIGLDYYWEKEEILQQKVSYERCFWEDARDILSNEIRKKEQQEEDYKEELLFLEQNKEEVEE